MTAVSSTNNNTSTPTPSSTPTINADFNMFVKLLTTQMQNQDPLNPMDTSQYTQQLVQYSQVEQSMAQTSTLKSMLAAMSTQDLTQASGLIGRSVTVDSATTGITATSPAQWNWSTTGSVATVTAKITDANGKLVDKRSFDPKNIGSFTWDGTLSGGGKAAPGAYTLSIDAADANGTALTTAITSQGTVSQVAMDNNKVMIGINGQKSPISSVKQVAVN